MKLVRESDLNKVKSVVVVDQFLWCRYSVYLHVFARDLVAYVALTLRRVFRQTGSKEIPEAPAEVELEMLTRNNQR